MIAQWRRAITGGELGTIDEFHQQILADLLGDADDSAQSLGDVFFEHMSERLEATGEIETADRAHFSGSGPQKGFEEHVGATPTNVSCK